MAGMTARVDKPPRQISRDLWEYAPLTYAPLKAGQVRIDRDKGIIYGLKFAGRSSPNKHLVDGVSGSEYAPEAYRESLDLYDGLKLNSNHPPRDANGKPLKQDRKAEDRLGKTFGPYLVDGEVYGNVRLLKTHPLYERILEAAESEDMSDCFALSHNALGRGEVRDGKYVITHIVEVRSLDLVADGGSNRSLTESREKPMKTLNAFLESKPGLKPKYAKLLELFEGAGDMEAQGDDYRDHLHQARKLCEDSGDYETASAIHKMMKPKSSDDEGGGGEEPDGAEKAKKEDEKEESKATQESRELSELRREKSCRLLCESLSFHPSEIQLDSLMGLANDVKRRKFIAEQKTLRKSGPQSRSLHTGPQDQELQESAVPKDLDEAWAQMMAN